MAGQAPRGMRGDQVLGCNLLGKRFYTGWFEFETHPPLADQAAAIDLGRGERPALCCGHGQVGEVLAMSRRIKFRLRHTSRRVDVNKDGNAHGSRDGG